MSIIINEPPLASVMAEVMREMGRSYVRPYPMSHLRRTALMVEEAGEALKEALNVTRDGTYRGSTPPRRYSESDYLKRLRNELIQTAAMALRQLVELELENGNG